MDDVSDMILATATRIFRDRVTPAVLDAAENGMLDQPLWSEIETAGLSTATFTEEQGGIALPLGAALSLARTSGEFTVPAPLVEALIAGRMLAASGLPAPAGILTVGPVLKDDRLTLARRGTQWVLSGTLRRIPWGRHAAAIVAVASEEDGGPRTVVIAPQKVAREDRNWANEPRDRFEFSELLLADGQVGSKGKGVDVRALHFEGALFRAAQIVGALDRTMSITLQHARDRVQFGRPVASFQAVQQQLAELACQVAAAAAALDGAITADGGMFAIAAAKARIGEGATEATAIAHRICAAMGFSHEHPLHRSTRRAWSWRDEFGTEVDWARWLGDIVAARGGAGVWPLLTDPPGHFPSQ